MTCASELMAMVSEKRDDSRRWTPRPCTRSPRTTGHDLLPRAKPCCRPRIGRPITRSRGCSAGGLTPPSGTSTTHSCRGVHPPLCCLGRSRRPRRGGIRGACSCLPKPRRARPSRRIPRGPLVSASPAGTEGGPVPGRHRRISGGRLMAEAGSGSPDGCGTEARPCESARGHGTASRTHSAGFAEEPGREAASSDSTSHARAELGSGVKLQVASLPVRLERGSSHHRTRVSV